MHTRRNKVIALAVAAALAGSACVHAEAPASANALTIYSVARPGAISADTYRNGGSG